VAVLWGNKNADIDLNVEFPNGENDQNEQICLFEHFHANSESRVNEGLYPVYVTYSEIAEIINKWANDIYITIKVPGKIETQSINYAELDYLDGHVADIKVQMNYTSIGYNGTFLCDYWSVGIRRGYSGGGGGGLGGWGNGGGEIRGVVRHPHLFFMRHYIYDIIWYISKSILGPLSKADVNIYEAKDYNFASNSGSNSLFTSKTTEGDALFSAGNILAGC
jgi:hypothetical protein